MNVFRMMVVHKIQSMVKSSSGGGAGVSSMRWNSTKELLYELVYGPFPPSEKESTRRKKYIPIDLTTFNYDSLDDTSLILMFETVCRRYYTCM